MTTVEKQVSICAALAAVQIGDLSMWFTRYIWQPDEFWIVNWLDEGPLEFPSRIWANYEEGLLFQEFSDVSPYAQQQHGQDVQQVWSAQYQGGVHAVFECSIAAVWRRFELRSFFQSS